MRKTVGLALVHFLGRPYQVFPSVFAAARTRNNVVKESDPLLAGYWTDI